MRPTFSSLRSESNFTPPQPVRNVPEKEAQDKSKKVIYYDDDDKVYDGSS